MPHQNNSINYIEFPMVKLDETKSFYSKAFGWRFTDWGPDYLSFDGAGIDGGFNREDKVPVNAPGVLVVLYAEDLEKTGTAISAAGGKIIKPAYGFPGGRRFHFTDPNGNQLAVWSEK
ncbi:VOC family protein [Kiloniella laminariae]|uniref:VOC family protein n=1 Tax=Kiloniella laminariae TaxID=454162 RepID=A0ABT4LET2_9PROT|nr:VOC family protein [Kiloniella laminariae]MCZ4279613.1 VOC family protein [Kiloniella laminariae]